MVETRHNFEFVLGLVLGKWTSTWNRFVRPVVVPTVWLV
jgi:hypothetical protein